MTISVFVTYCWENLEHDNKVIQLTDLLRKQGFAAEMDKSKSQQETAIDFIQMMHEAMTKYDKVIVVLSENYKLKAEMFKDGVGMEYSFIIKDIIDNPNKYVLVSFQGISKNITPLSFSGREIVDLQKGDDELEKLYSKLMNHAPIQFAPIGENLPQLKQKEIPDLELNNRKGIEFEKIIENFEGDSIRMGKLKSCQRKIIFSFRNNSGKTIEGCQIELNINPKFLYREDLTDQKNNLITSIDKKIFANQQILTEPIKINLTDSNCIDADKSFIVLKLFSDMGEVTIEVPIFDCVTFKSNFNSRKIELADFL